MKLRPYQNESIELLRNSFRKNKRVILCLPTGAGKTVTFSEMIRLNYEKGKVSLILTDRIELCTQALKSIVKHEIPAQIIKGGTKQKDIYLGAKVFIGMVESINNHLNKGLQINPDLIIIDEAHKGNFTKVIEKFPNSYVIGATATPVGKHIPKIYTDIIQNIDIPELIEGGYLSKMISYKKIGYQDFNGLQKDSKGEFTEESQYKFFKDTKIFNGFVEVYSGKKTLVFCCNIQHCFDVQEMFEKEGIESKVITSETSKEERVKTLDEFSKGNFNLLINCGILTTGYDEPTIEDIVVIRATTSLALWLQMCGRGSRIIPNEKESFTIYDFGGNEDRLGPWNAKRDWKLKDEKEKEGGSGIGPVKECPKCERLIAANTVKCKEIVINEITGKEEFCNNIFHKFMHNGILIGGNEIEIKTPSHLVGKKIGDLTTLELFQLQESKKYKPSFIWRIVRSLGIDSIEKFSKLAGYKKGWIYSQKKDLENCTFTNFVLK